jgi:acetyl esterase/lipase
MPSVIASCVILTLLLSSGLSAFAQQGSEAYATEWDLPYVTNGHQRQRLDIVYPKGSKEPVPLVVWVHGGGWQGGSKKGAPVGQLMQQGYAVAAIEYRLSQHAIFPAQIEDCKAAIRWIRKNAERLRINPERIAVWGASAGGHLAALLGMSASEKRFDVGENLDQSSRVQAVINFFGPTNLATIVSQSGKDHLRALGLATGNPLSKLLGANPHEVPEKTKAASPVTYATLDDAPTFTVHGDKDPIVPIAQGRELDAALRQAGVESMLHVIRGGGHGSPGFDAPELATELRQFLEKHLRR